MEHASNENIDITQSLNRMSTLDLNKKMSGKLARGQEKKKYKERGNIRIDKAKATCYQNDLSNKAPHYTYFSKDKRIGNNEFRISVNNRDIEICKRTAAMLRSQRESIHIDQSLASHLAILSFTSHHYLVDQQRHSIYFQERFRQMEVSKWLSTKNEQERKIYIERSIGSGVVNS